MRDGSSASAPPPPGPNAGWWTPARFGSFLALALFIAFPKAALGLGTFFYRDFGVLAYPAIFHYHESFWRGEMPLWNPLSNCGAPFLAQWGTMVLYPFAVFYLLLPLPWSVNFFCLAHLFWAGLGMYFLARQWTGHGFASAVAGTAFVFNGVTLSCLLWPNYTVALGWMPWVVAGVERAWTRGGRTLVIAAVLAAWQLLSGVPELVLFTWLILLARWITALFGRATAAHRLVVRPLIVIAIASGLTAAQLLPFFELLSHSQRTSGVDLSKWALPIWGWANQFVPQFHAYLNFQGLFFQHGQEFFSSTYLGVAVLALAALACITVRAREIWVLGGLAVLGMWLAMGDAAGLYEWARRLVPLLAITRYPVKFMLLFAFATVLLAAFAIRWVQCGEARAGKVSAASDPEATATGIGDEGAAPAENATPLELKKWLALVWLIAGAIIVALLWSAYRDRFPLDHWTATWEGAFWRAVFLAIALSFVAVAARSAGDRHGAARRKLCEVALLTLLVTDVWTHTPNQNPTVPPSTLAPGLWALSAKLPPPRLGESRALIAPDAEQRLLMSRVRDFQHDLLGKRAALWSHLNLLEQIPKVGGSSTLQVRESTEVQSLFQTAAPERLRGLADFLAVSTITAPGQVVEWTTRNTHLPLAAAGQRPVFLDGASALGFLTNVSFAPREVVVLPPETRSHLTATNAGRARILEQNWSAHRIELQTEAQTPSLVVIAQSFYPAWRAYVDGAPTPLFRANHGFQALQIPEGRHTVLVRYEDQQFAIGVVISLATLLVCAAVWHLTGEPRRSDARD